MIKRHKSLAVLAVIVIVALISFGLNVWLRSSSHQSSPKVDPTEREHLQDLIIDSFDKAVLR